MILLNLTHVYIAAGIAALYAAILRFTVGGKSRSDEPNLIPHWIPFFGHAFRFAINKRKFFLWAEYDSNVVSVNQMNTNAISMGE